MILMDDCDPFEECMCCGKSLKKCVCADEQGMVYLQGNEGSEDHDSETCGEDDCQEGEGC